MTRTESREDEQLVAKWISDPAGQLSCNVGELPPIATREGLVAGRE